MSLEAIVAIKTLWPAVAISGVVMLVGWRPWSKRPPASAYWAAPLALGGSFVAAFLIVCEGWPGLPPAERWQWLLTMAIAATTVGVAGSVLGRQALAQAGCALGLAIVVGWLLKPPGASSEYLWKLGVGATVAASFIMLEPPARRHPGPGVPLALVIMFAGASHVFVASRFAKLALVCASLAAACGVIFAVALCNRRLSLAYGAMHVAAALWPPMVAIGWVYDTGSAPAVSFWLLAIAPVTLWLAEIRPLRTLEGVWAVLVRAALVAVPIGLAVALSMGKSGAVDYT